MVSKTNLPSLMHPVPPGQTPLSKLNTGSCCIGSSASTKNGKLNNRFHKILMHSDAL